MFSQSFLHRILEVLMVIRGLCHNTLVVVVSLPHKRSSHSICSLQMWGEETGCLVYKWTAPLPYVLHKWIKVLLHLKSRMRAHK
jgi:hypothetical protein